MNIALIRQSSIPMASWDVDNQLRAIQSVVGDEVEVIHSDKHRLIRQAISVRLQSLNLLEKVEEMKHTIYIYDLSRLFTSIKEIKRGLMFFKDHNTHLRSVKEGLNTQLQECPVDTQINYIGEFLNTYSLEKLAASIGKVNQTRQGRPAKNCLLALNCIKSLRNGASVTQTAKLNKTTRDYIYRHALTHPTMQLYYLSLTSDDIASETDVVYQEAMKLVRKIKITEAEV